jgi:pimeloyl-ACP methyl ester carboxylesterase
MRDRTKKLCDKRHWVCEHRWQIGIELVGHQSPCGAPLVDDGWVGVGAEESVMVIKDAILPPSAYHASLQHHIFQGLPQLPLAPLLHSLMKSNQVVLLAFVALASTVPAYSSKRSLFHGGGYNDFHCKPSAEHPNPVIMLHGLGANANVWSYMGPRFALKGYCAFSMTYGRLPNIPLLGGLNDLIESAHEVSEFVDKVLASTGASKVDLLGHSEGSTLTRVYLKYNHGVAKTGEKNAMKIPIVWV